MTSGTKSNSSVVAMLEVRHNGKQVVVPVAVGGFGYQNGIRIDSNAVTSAYGKNKSCYGSRKHRYRDKTGRCNQ